MYGRRNRVVLNCQTANDRLYCTCRAHCMADHRFYRADKSRNRQSGGSGLGLSIVKFLIESHNGTIEINSELTKGTQVLIFINKYNTSL